VRLSATEQNGRAATYGYDNDYRLTSETITGEPSGRNGAVNYTYDVVGNRTQQSSILPGITSGTFSYDANDRITSDVYDANGNTTSSGGLSYTYDFENRFAGSGGLSIVYDADGNRVSENIAGTTTKYLVDTLNPTGLPQVLDEVVNGSVTRTYAYGLQRISQNQLISGVWTPSFYGYDGHDNVRFLTSMAAAVTDTYQYDAFGNQLASTGTTPNSYFYSGERLDASLSFYDLRARYYQQATGRFWARDPIEGRLCCGLSWNPYIYVVDNPVNTSDPAGLQAILEYKTLRKIIAGTGLQAHHLIEKRFLYIADLAACELAIALTPAEHQVYTNAWRAAIPYGQGTACATAAEVLSTAQALYSDVIFARILAVLAAD